jgi:arylsulfatase A-like enzyme
MRRREFLRASAATVAGGPAFASRDSGEFPLLAQQSGPTPAAQGQGGRKPNFIFVLVDDMSWGDLGCFGHPYAKTPHLDQMAKQGVKFTQFYSLAPECAPSRSGLLTGRVPFKAGKPDNNRPRLDPTLPNVNSLLKAAGYATGHFGKWHLANGFDEPKDEELHAYGIDEAKVDHAVNADAPRRIMDHAIDFIERNRNRPFHINIWQLWPHLPVNPNVEQLSVYKDLVVNPGDFSELMQRKYARVPDLQERMRRYLATVTAIDKQVGRLLSKLDEFRLSEDTVVVFSSDNGANAQVASDRKPIDMWASNQGPYNGGKFELREGGIRMPCLAQWKGRIRGGQVNSSLWRMTDWAPTVCSLAGVKTDGIVFDGKPLPDILMGKQRERSEPLFWGWGKQLAVREGRWKLVNGELYDLETDPSEQRNLAQVDPERAHRMASLIQDWLKK